MTSTVATDSPPPLESSEEADLSTETRRRMRRWLRVLLLLSLLILMVGLSPELPKPEGTTPLRPASSISPGPEDLQILPGERVGFVYLGLSIEVVESRLGKGQAKPTNNAVLYRFDQAGISCAVQRGQINSILVNNPAFRTAADLGVGSDADLVVRSLGDQYEYEVLNRNSGPGVATPEPEGPWETHGSYVLHYWGQGIHLSLKSDRVESITVTMPVHP